MKELRFLHTADWHADTDPKKQAKLEDSLKQIVEYCKEVKVNAIIHSGDVWDRSQRYQINSGVPIVLRYLHELSHLVDFIFITKGNNSHDEPGSISLLHQIEPNIYAYEYPVCLAVGTQVIDLIRNETEELDYVEYIISLIPYPTKASLLIDDSIDNNNAAFIEKFESIFEHIGEITQAYKCPKILAFHGNVVGSRLSSGQTLVSQDIMVAPLTLEKAKHDYFALGHIHLNQEVSINPWMIYSGSIYNKNWGETERKSFQVISFTGGKPEEMLIETIPLTAARPMVTIEAEFTPGMTSSDFIWNNGDPALERFANAEFRFRCKIKENDRKLLTDEKIQTIRNYFGPDTKIEFDIIPAERDSRSEQIMQCTSLIDEVKEYAAVINQEINGTIKKKVLELQEKGVDQ